MAELQATIDALSTQPESGHRTDEPEVRVKFLGRYPYKMFYRTRSGTIEVPHIRHAARRPWAGR